MYTSWFWKYDYVEQFHEISIMYQNHHIKSMENMKSYLQHFFGDTVAILMTQTSVLQLSTVRGDYTKKKSISSKNIQILRDASGCLSLILCLTIWGAVVFWHVGNFLSAYILFNRYTIQKWRQILTDKRIFPCSIRKSVQENKKLENCYSLWVSVLFSNKTIR